MCAGRDQVRDITGGLAFALDHDGLHVASVAGKNFDRNPWQDFLGAAKQFHLPALDQWVVIFGKVAHAVTLVLVSMLPFALLHVVDRLWKSGLDRAVFANRVPTTMIEVQM
jgi:hypothetical protein